jgi:hypothetical protein
MIQPLTHLVQMGLFAFAGLTMLLAFLMHFIARENEPHQYDLRGVKGEEAPRIELPKEEPETERAVQEWLPSEPISAEMSSSASGEKAIRPGELTRTTKTYFFEKPKYTGVTTRAERRSMGQE